MCIVIEIRRSIPPFSGECSMNPKTRPFFHKFTKACNALGNHITIHRILGIMGIGLVIAAAGLFSACTSDTTAPVDTAAPSETVILSVLGGGDIVMPEQYRANITTELLIIGRSLLQPGDSVMTVVADDRVVTVGRKYSVHVPCSNTSRPCIERQDGWEFVGARQGTTNVTLTSATDTTQSVMFLVSITESIKGSASVFAVSITRQRFLLLFVNRAREKYPYFTSFFIFDI